MVRSTAVILGIALSVISSSHTKPPNPACPIKGTVNTDSDHIYLIPGDKKYADWKVEGSRGERWFCNEKEVANAGWHH